MWPPVLQSLPQEPPPTPPLIKERAAAKQKKDKETEMAKRVPYSEVLNLRMRVSSSSKAVVPHLWYVVQLQVASSEKKNASLFYLTETRAGEARLGEGQTADASQDPESGEVAGSSEAREDGGAI